jgi:hypothetical protein
MRSLDELRHRDATCGSDLVSDTPTQYCKLCSCHPHYSCTGTPVEMTMNYMDYTDDRGMYMFSNGQKSRMAAFLFQVEQEQVWNIILNLKGGDSINHLLFLFYFFKVFLKITPLLSIFYFTEFSIAIFYP